MKLKLILHLAFLCLSVFNYNVASTGEGSHLKKVFFQTPLRRKFNGFLDEVLRQVPSGEFFKFVDQLPALQQVSTDAEIYKIILSNIDAIKPKVQLYSQLQALRHQQAELAGQMRLLIPTSSINGYVEIGTPGSYFSSLRKNIHIAGDIYAVCDATTQSYIQYLLGISSIQEIFKKKQFLLFNNYDIKSLEAIKDNSIELVVCVIGLHHIPAHKIVPYLRAIKRILKPGGIFILREHDVRTIDIYSLTSAAHSIYNALMLQLPIEQECAELRNFQPLSYWIKLLTTEGFAVEDQRLTQQYDPTCNTLIKCIKPLSGQEALLQKIKLELRAQKDYERSEILTYLGSPEWLNVDVAQEYSAFINHTPWYQFPYIASVKSYWQVFAHSWRLAAQKKGNWAVFSSSSTLMNLFIGMTMTVEYGAKSLISAPVRWLYAGEESQTLKLLVKDKYNELASLDARVTVLNSYSKSIKLIEVPRYKEFVEIMKKVAMSAIELIEIAGQTHIQFKVRQPKELPFPTAMLGKAKKEYEWQLPTQPAYRYCVLSVPVQCIKEVILSLPQHSIELLYIHAF
jgi:SAM-dependent methyltransferase